MEQLREISSRASEVAINKHDSYDYFGMYIASMLRNIGSPKAIQLQQNITNLVTNAICQPEYITTDNSMSGTTSWRQCNLNTPSASNNEDFLTFVDLSV